MSAVGTLQKICTLMYNLVKSAYNRDDCHVCNNGCGRYGYNHSNKSIQTTIMQMTLAAICCNNKLTTSSIFCE